MLRITTGKTEYTGQKAKGKRQKAQLLLLLAGLFRRFIIRRSDGSYIA